MNMLLRFAGTRRAMRAKVTREAPRFRERAIDDRSFGASTQPLPHPLPHPSPTSKTSTLFRFRHRCASPRNQTDLGSVRQDLSD